MTIIPQKLRRLHWQIFSHDKSHYERPNQKWICGKQSSGCACHMGPDESGNCRATHECRPIKEDDRWHCTRSKQQGGKCEKGPRPDGSCCIAIEKCTPILSPRAKRGALTYAASILMIGLIVFFVTGSLRASFISPGNSGSFHGAIATDCKACHSADKLPSAAWIATAVHPFDGKTESGLCLNCHDLGANALFTHDLPKKELEDQAAEKKRKANFLQRVGFFFKGIGFQTPKNAKGEIACAVCHQEHRGSKFDIKALTNEQCQSCHVNSFKSFQKGHPEFVRYPYKTRLNLKFDHVSHIKKSFPDKKKDIACTECHTTDLQGKMMLVGSYQKTCSSCHDEQIRGEERSGEKGIRVFTIPGIDVESLKKKQINIGFWIKEAEGEITPFMDLLLSADDDYAEAKKDLDGVDLLDLLDADETTLKAVQREIWAVKKLYVDIALKGQLAIKERLETTLKRELRPEELMGLSAMLPAEFMDATLRAWLPPIYGEIMQRENPAMKMAPGKAEENKMLSKFMLDNKKENDERAMAGGWYKNDEDFSVYYRPTGHADAFMQGWLNATVTRTPKITSAVFDLISKEKTPGVCMKCHSINDKAGQRSINWYTKRPQDVTRHIVDFKHAAHIGKNSDSCVTCHKLNVDADFMAAYKDDATEFSSSFTNMNRKTCATCHTDGRAGDNCVTCHKYHMGEVKSAKTPGLQAKQ